MKIKNKLAQINTVKILTIVGIVLMSFTMVWALLPSDNYKEYNEETKTASIYNSNDVLLGEFKLLTPIDYKVPRGYQKVAEIQITNSQDSSLLYDQMKFYNVKDSMAEIERGFDFKFLEDVYKNKTDEQ